MPPPTRRERAAPAQRTRLIALAVTGTAVVAGVLGVAAMASRGDVEVPDSLPLDAWAPYWQLDASEPELAQRSAMLRTVSPFWFTATGATTIATEPQTPADRAAAFVSTARAAGVEIVPSITDGTAPGTMAGILADPVTRTQHVDALVAFARAGSYDGLDLDYEVFAFGDDRSTWVDTRPNWVAFVDELAQRLHADGRTLTITIPPVYDEHRTPESGAWVYDYAAIAPLVDHIRVMAYDFSTARAGPIAPLDWVQRVVEGTARASGMPGKLVLGIPVYGYNWPVSTTGTCPEGLTEGRTGVTPRSVDDLAARRGAVPVADAAAGEWTFGYELVVSDGTTSCTQQREVHYVDADGALARIDIARRAGFGGVALWALGYEDASVWEEIAPRITPPRAP